MHRQGKVIARTAPLVFAAAIFTLFGLRAAGAQTPQDPYGHLDVVDERVIAGWACDPSSFGAALEVHLYNGPVGGGGQLLGGVTANENRVGDHQLANLCGGTYAHGFTFTVPLYLLDGQPRDIYAYALNVGDGSAPAAVLVGSPKRLSGFGAQRSCDVTTVKALQQLRKINFHELPGQNGWRVENTSPCTFAMSVEDYTIDVNGTQKLFDMKQVTVPAYSNQQYAVNVPACSHQVDARWGYIDYDWNTYALAGKIYESQRCPAPAAAQCSDGIDNDYDGKIDGQDPGCSSAQDNDEFNQMPGSSSSAYSQTSSAYSSYYSYPSSAYFSHYSSMSTPASQGYSSTWRPQCSDGRDNDGDGKKDMQDPGCSGPNDNSEGTWGWGWWNGGQDANVNSNAQTTVNSTINAFSGNGTDVQQSGAGQQGANVNAGANTDVNSAINAGSQNGTNIWQQMFGWWR